MRSRCTKYWIWLLAPAVNTGRCHRRRAADRWSRYAKEHRLGHGGGPTVRESCNDFGSRSFVFPQMQIEKIERAQFSIDHWRPGFMDYPFIAFTQSSTFGPTDAPLLARWAKLLAMIQISISLTIFILL